jgi:hypothetical protein
MMKEQRRDRGPNFETREHKAIVLPLEDGDDCWYIGRRFL